MLTILQHGMNALMWASDNGHAAIVDLLVDADADVNLGERVRTFVVYDATFTYIKYAN